MILYHGTNIEIIDIDLLKSKPNKDFGRGFYLTESLSQAQDMTRIKTDQLEWGSPIVMKYIFKVNLKRNRYLWYRIRNNPLGKSRFPS